MSGYTYEEDFAEHQPNVCMLTHSLLPLCMMPQDVYISLFCVPFLYASSVSLLFVWYLAGAGAGGGGERVGRQRREQAGPGGEGRVRAHRVGHAGLPQ